jgi:phage-related minor tail protein
VALDIGELVGKLSIDDKGMDKGLKKGESKFKAFGDKLTKLAMAGGLAAAAAFGGAILANLNQDAIGAKISAQLGGTTEDAKTYGKMAGKLYAENWGDSVETIGDTLKAVAKAQIVPDETDAALEDVTRRAQILADVFGQDVNGSVRAVQQLIRTGLVPDAKAGFDLIAAGIQGGVDVSDDLLDTLTEYPTQFRELGLTGAQALGLLQQGLQGGARDSDIVADALKEFAIRSKDASATSIDGFKSLGLNGKAMTAVFAKGGPEAAAGLETVLTKLREVKNPVEQARIATELFGTQSEDLGNALGSLDLNTISAEFDNAAGSIDRAGEAASNTDAAKLESFKREAMAAAQAIAADLVPSLDSMGGWVKDNASWLKPLVEILGATAIAIVAVNLATKAWAATEAAFVAVKGAATAAQWALNAAMLANPVGIIIAIILVLIGIIVLIATKTTWFQSIWKFVWGGIKAAALAVWGWISGTLWPGIEAVFKAIGGAAMWLWHSAIEPAWNGIVVAVQFAWRIISSVLALMGWAWVTFVAKPMLWAWQSVIWPAIQGIGMAATWLWSTILQPVFAFIWSGLQMIGAGAMWLWNNAILPAAQGIGAAFMWLWNNAISPAINAISTAISWVWNNAISPVFSFIKTGVTLVGNAIQFVFNKVSGWISSAFSGAVGIVKGAMNGIISAINIAISGINWVIDKANSIPGVNFPHVPSIPHLARGGAVSPTPGGTPVVMGDGGQVEYGVPKSDMESIIGKAVAAGGGHAEISIQVELIGDGVMKIVRANVRRSGMKTLEQTP